MQTPIPGTLARFYAGGYDLSPLLRGAKPSMAEKLEDFATLGDAWEKPWAVSESGQVSVEGFYEGSEDTVNAMLAAGVGVNGQVITLPTEDVLGKVAYGLVTSGSAYDVMGLGVASLVKVSAAFASRVGLERLLVLHPMGQEVAAGSGGVIDNAAASDYGATAHLHVKEITGAGQNVTVKIADSANGSTWADLITFAVVTEPGFPAAERKIVLGTVRQYLRWTISGTFTTVTFALAVGRGSVSRVITI